MRTTWPALALAIVMGFVGVSVSGALLGKHMGKSSEFFDSLCEGESAEVSCDVVLSSEWAYFPPTDPKSESPGWFMPTALIGQVYFAFMLVWYVFVGRVSLDRRAWHLLPLGVNALGILGSIWFVYVMKTRIGAWCPLCLISHGANLLLFVCTALLWPRKKLATEAVSQRSAHPSARLAIATLVLVWAIGVIQYNGMTMASMGRQYAAQKQYLKQLQENVQALVGLFRAGKEHTVTVRADDPSRDGRQAVSTIVGWSDFQCPNCRRFAEMYDETIAPSFDGAARFVFKHYPMDQDCNPYMSRTFHDQACDMAMMAEAARAVGGDEAFWKAHDLLFASQHSADTPTVATLAEELGLDTAAFAEAMRSEAVANRIREDIEQARKLGVTGTPSVFLDGRKVDSLTRGVPEFWASLGRASQRARAMMAAKQQAATQDNQGPPTAP